MTDVNRPDKTARRSIALFGEDHGVPLEYALATVGGDADVREPTAFAISVGGRAVLVKKAEQDVPNEDCLYAFDDGRCVVHVVADGHHGHESSHDLVELLADEFDRRGPTIDLIEALERIHQAAADSEPVESRSTLLVASLDRREGLLRGFSIGDSAIFLGDLESGVRRVIAPTQHYAAPWDLASLAVPASSRFEIPVRDGMWVVTCTDGVTECEYGSPDTSIQASDIEALMIRAGGSPEAFVDDLAAMALKGVRGHPGGEDNVAIIASIV